MRSCFYRHNSSTFTLLKTFGIRAHLSDLSSSSSSLRKIEELLLLAALPFPDLTDRIHILLSYCILLQYQSLQYQNLVVLLWVTNSILDILTISMYSTAMTSLCSITLERVNQLQRATNCNGVTKNVLTKSAIAVGGRLSKYMLTY